MEIAFRKIGKSPQNFELKSDLLTFKGTIRYDCANLLLLNARIEGQISLNCDICAQDYTAQIDENIELFISDGIYDGDNMDVIEAQNSIVNLDEIFNSEVELYKNDYHTCNSCK
ncbi:MAG: hypothetical protein U9N42_02370 [Campylobacterota bacterium]|nr:hypothetical protein [Campylobacterota bacterium]